MTHVSVTVRLRSPKAKGSVHFSIALTPDELARAGALGPEAIAAAIGRAIAVSGDEDAAVPAMHGRKR